ncbi:MAG: MBL fold metallo-hydrolase, partial [Acidobacteriota bacterium]
MFRLSQSHHGSGGGLPLGLTLIILALILPLAVLPANAQGNFDDAEITSEKLADGVYVLFGAGGNIGVSAGPDGVVLIDDQYAPLTDKILAALDELPEAANQRVRFVINTHWHGDHTGGNENLAGKGALIVAHEEVRTRMSTEQVMEAFNSTVPASPDAALPVVTFAESVTFHVNDHELHAFHVSAAHTDGDSLIHFRGADVLHMGDTFFNGMYPFVDVGSGGHLTGLIGVISKAVSIAGENTKIIPGHGPVTDRAGLQTYLDLLKTVDERVKPLYEAGKSRDEVVAANVLEDLNETYGGGFMNPDVFVGLVYDGYALVEETGFLGSHFDHDGHPHTAHDGVTHAHGDHVHYGHHEHHDDGHSAQDDGYEHDDADGHPHTAHDNVKHTHGDHVHDGHHKHHHGLQHDDADGHDHTAHDGIQHTHGDHVHDGHHAHHHGLQHDDADGHPHTAHDNVKHTHGDHVHDGHHAHHHGAKHDDADGHPHTAHDNVKHTHNDHVHDGHHEHHDVTQHDDADGHPHTAHDNVKHTHGDHVHDGHHKHHDGEQHDDHDGHDHTAHDNIKHTHNDHVHDGHHEHHDGHSAQDDGYEHDDADGHPHTAHDNVKHSHGDHVHDGHHKHHDGEQHDDHDGHDHTAHDGVKHTHNDHVHDGHHEHHDG